jgi:hypothetical protein
VSHNYFACPRCGFSTRRWGRAPDAVNAAARLAAHLHDSHPEYRAAAVSAAFQQEEKHMPNTAKHASVVLHVSHPEGISEHHEKVLAEAEALATGHLETNGFEVGFKHTHTHRHHHHDKE